MTILQLYYIIPSYQRVLIMQNQNTIFLGKEINIPAELFNELVNRLYTADDVDGTLIVIHIEEGE